MYHTSSICLVQMKFFAKFDEIPSMTFQGNKITDTLSFGRPDGWMDDGQRENSIPSHKHSLRGYNILF